VRSDGSNRMRKDDPADIGDNRLWGDVMREQWIESGEAKLFIAEDGAGPTIVMLHGGMASHHAVLPMVSPLADRFRLVTPDLRASGRSWWSGALTFDLLADDVVRVLDHIGVERAVVGGVSGGSGVALRAALRHPSRVSGLLLIKPVYAGDELGYTEQQRSTFVAMDAIASRAMDEGIEVLRPLYANLPESIRERALALMATYDPASVVSTSGFVASGAQPFASVDDLEFLRMPTLIVRGDDALHPASVSDLYVANIAACTSLPASTADVPAAIAAFCGSVNDFSSGRAPS
jgi:3-oxoadipate enol-lactonase